MISVIPLGERGAKGDLHAPGLPSPTIWPVLLVLTLELAWFMSR